MCYADLAGGRRLRWAPLRLVARPDDGCGALARGRLFGWEAFIWSALHTVGDANPLQVVISSMNGAQPPALHSPWPCEGAVDFRDARRSINGLSALDQDIDRVRAGAVFLALGRRQPIHRFVVPQSRPVGDRPTDAPTSGQPGCDLRAYRRPAR